MNKSLMTFFYSPDTRREGMCKFLVALNLKFIQLIKKLIGYLVAKKTLFIFAHAIKFGKKILYINGSPGMISKYPQLNMMHVV